MSVINYIDATATLGQNVRVWHFAVIQAGVVLCSHVSIGSGTEVGRDSVIGARSRISAHVFLPAKSSIGYGVFIGPGCVFTDDRYPRVQNPNYTAEPPTIGDHTSIGAGCVILPGVKIGSNCLIGAGTVVTRDVHDNTILRNDNTFVYRPAPYREVAQAN